MSEPADTIIPVPSHMHRHHSISIVVCIVVCIILCIAITIRPHLAQQHQYQQIIHQNYGKCCRQADSGRSEPQKILRLVCILLIILLLLNKINHIQIKNERRNSECTLQQQKTWLNQI